MKFRLLDEINLIPLTEANLNRVVNGHDEFGYAIISASRQNLWKNIHTGEVIDKDPKDYVNFIKLVIGSQEHVDANNIRTKQLKELLKNNNISYIPVFGGFKEEDQPKAFTEKSFIVFPFNWKTRKYMDFDIFIDIIFEMVNKFNQDAILIKYKDKNPRYFDPKTKAYADDYEFTGTSINDITQQYFTALKKWDDISRKDNFQIGKPQRFTFEAYMNDFPQTINEHRIRSNSGELVRFENHP